MRGRGFRRMGPVRPFRRPIVRPMYRGWYAWGWGPGLWGMGCLLPILGAAAFVGAVLLRAIVR